MARDIEKEIPLYFYSQESHIFTGEVGSSGNGDDYILPSGMTEIEPIAYDIQIEYIIFDEDTKTWSKKFINEYLNMTQEEKDLYDEQVAINTAQQKYIDRLGETMDKLLGYIASTNPLTAPQQLFVVEFRNDYADYILKRDA